MKKRDIFVTMAKLREQRRLIDAAYNMCACNEDYKPKSFYEAANKMMGVMSEAEIVNAAVLLKIFNNDGKDYPKTAEDKGYWHRRNKIGSLFKNSVSDGFFTRDTSKERGEKIVDYYSITGDGTDLLHWLGFLKVATQKYSKTLMFIWGLIGGAILTGVPYLAALFS